jgi:hypothetical protein
MLEVEESRNLRFSAYCAFFLAMVENARGNSDNAKDWFERACAWTDDFLESPTDDGGIPWTYTATLKLLRRETSDRLSAVN